MNGKMGHCLGCNAAMDPDAIFCNECGMAERSASPPAHNKPITPPSNFAPITNLLCPGCNKACATEDKFCRHCAFDLSKITRVSSARFCTGCGDAFRPGDRFCRHCAMDLSNSDHTFAVPVVTQSSVSETTKEQSPSTAIPFVISDIEGSKSTRRSQEIGGKISANGANDGIVLLATGPSSAPGSPKPLEQRLPADVDYAQLLQPVVTNRLRKPGSALGVAIGCVGALLMITSFVALGWARNYIQKNLFTSGLGGLVGYQDSTFELAKGVQELAPLGLIAGLVLLILGGVLAIARRF